MRYTRLDQMPCSIARTLDVVGEWWTMLLVRDALRGVTRFDEFHRRLGISRTVLKVRLDRLVETGIMDKRQYLDRPPRSEYVLTDKGRALFPVLIAMLQWGDAWAADEAGPPVELLHRTCGQVMTPHYVCDHCGDPLELGAVAAKPTARRVSDLEETTP